MTIQKENKDVSSQIDERDVVAYLKKNPNFLSKHPEVLAELDISHETGDAVSLIERQVSVLRDDNRQLRHRIRELVDIARENDALMAKLHQLSVAIVRVDSLDGFVSVLDEHLKRDFSADQVSVRFLFESARGRDEFVAEDHEGLHLFESILLRKKPVCGRFNNQQLEFLFGEQAEKVGSAAVMPLADVDSIGLFAIASADKERFRAGMSTVFLSYLAEVAAAVLKRLA